MEDQIQKKCNMEETNYLRRNLREALLSWENWILQKMGNSGFPWWFGS